MLFWITATLLAIAVAAVLFRPFLPGRKPAMAEGGEDTGTDIAFYRAQLAGVERDLARGTIEEAEAERMRIEIGRRILAADRARPAPVATGPRMAGAIMAVLGAVLVIGGGIGAYLWLGQPGYPDLPLRGRIASAAERLVDLPSQEDAESAAADAIAAQIITPPDDIAAIVADLHEAIAADTGLTNEIYVLREFLVSVRDFPEAARLSAEINAREGDQVTVDDLLYQVDLMLFATSGIVSQEAAEVLDHAAELRPDAPGVHFLRGYLMSQIGRADLAFSLWRPLAEGGEALEPWRSRAQRMVETAASAAGVDYTLPDEMLDSVETSPDIPPEAITAMVEGLATRLAEQGGPPEDWAQLIRALGVLGQNDRARAIWQEAQQVFADDPGLSLINDTAADAGLVQ